jgi:hypothetical protein
MVKSRISFYSWIILMAAWFVGACALLTPLNSMRPVEDSSSPIGSPNIRMVTDLIEEYKNDSSVIVYLQYPTLRSSNYLSEAVESFNQNIRLLVEDEADAFLRSIEGFPIGPEFTPHPSTLLSGYRIFIANEKLISLILDFSQFPLGAAHPLPYTIAITYDVQNMQVVNLVDLFQTDSNYLNLIAEFSRISLEDQQMMFFDEGIQPRLENFDTWCISPDGLIIFFDVYQVAPYAVGPQQVVISFDELKEILKPELLNFLQAEAIDVQQPVVPIHYLDQGGDDI